jgi:ADP-heptose:LPS heptosyltransferase
MHIAAAVGTPVIALFGPTDPALVGPYGPGHTVLRPPTGNVGDITVEEVLAAAKPFLV